MFFDGSTVDGVEGLRAFLLGRHDLFVRTFTEKLATYALGRSVSPGDMLVIVLVATGERAQLHAQLGGGRASAFPHFDEERVHVGLGDEANNWTSCVATIAERLRRHDAAAVPDKAFGARAPCARSGNTSNPPPPPYRKCNSVDLEAAIVFPNAIWYSYSPT